MSMNAINAYTSTMAQSGVMPKSAESKKSSAAAKADGAVKSNTAGNTSGEASKADASSKSTTDGVVFEASKEGLELAKNAKADRTAIVKQLKADLESQKQSLINMVREAIGQQVSMGAAANATEDDVWKLLASGEFTIDEAAKAKAQEAISEDGYWGVEKTSDRIVEFAKALSGGDVSKADKLFAAFKKGYEQATKTWGKALPDISKKTYDAVEKKFDAWKNGEEATKAEAKNEEQ